MANCTITMRRYDAQEEIVVFCMTWATHPGGADVDPVMRGLRRELDVRTLIRRYVIQGERKNRSYVDFHAWNRLV